MRKPLLAFALSGSLIALPALADWSLDPARSHLSFVSIKGKDVAEISTFDNISGTIDAEGQVVVTLMLDSVDTLIPIRNERMRQFLFETTNYKEAVLKAKVDSKRVANMTVGSIEQVSAEGSLSLHGQTQAMTLTMQVAKLDANTLMVAGIKPLIVDATKFGMTDGVEKLREIAGLESISKAVPVTFVITFTDSPSAKR